ncbi:hypothetical protein BAY61_01470 [Prauserella marina]|uniref:Uncharacterized protein n=1 Tax=Prauserella marina TaxID=530584 RepID=A0A222VIX9_9PSEU|nr:hypothetical protein [Prauserella marina]ASR33875.1 hypothetical protein BAY61_01470 [Prauserella marina]PWV82469.1 hypothetical protein DES30_102712 [Prauserella marina]SDC69930.1 hypothetical protein SAMN05421630_103248 [Prauserella marina]
MHRRTARALWEFYEPVHDVTYFSPEARAAADTIGMQGFYMGYFAMRAAPLGQVPPAVVTSCFYVFHDDRVARALPDAWNRTSPQDALDARLTGAGAALRRILGEAADSDGIAEAADLAWRAAESADSRGRVLAAANQALDRPDQPILALWQALTTLREHRGDGHVAALVAADVGPVEAMLLKAHVGEADSETQRTVRRWSEEEWAHGTAELRARGWLNVADRLTEAGRAAHDEIERRTDDAALSPWQALGGTDTERLAELLAPIAEAVRSSGVLPEHNPVGLTSGTPLR